LKADEDWALQIDGRDKGRRLDPKVENERAKNKEQPADAKRKGKGNSLQRGKKKIKNSERGKGVTRG